MSPQEKGAVKDLLQQEGDQKDQSLSKALVPYDPINKPQVRIIADDGTIVAQSTHAPSTTEEADAAKDQQGGGSKVKEQQDIGPILTYTPPSD